MKHKDPETYPLIIGFPGKILNLYNSKLHNNLTIYRRHDSALTDGSDVKIDLTGVSFFFLHAKNERGAFFYNPRYKKKSVINHVAPFFIGVLRCR